MKIESIFSFVLFSFVIISNYTMRPSQILFNNLISRGGMIISKSSNIPTSRNLVFRGITFGGLILSLIPTKVSCAEKERTSDKPDLSKTTKSFDGKKSEPFDFEKMIAEQFDENGSFSSVRKLFETGVPGQIGYGFIMGYSSGFCMKKISRVAAFVLGSSFILIQSLSYSGLIKVDYEGVQKKVESVFDLNNDGKVDEHDLKFAQDKVMAALQYQMPAGSAFFTGMIAGLRS